MLLVELEKAKAVCDDLSAAWDRACRDTQNVGKSEVSGCGGHRAAKVSGGGPSQEEVKAHRGLCLWLVDIRLDRSEEVEVRPDRAHG
jgi:hypothetical protein